MLTLEDDIKAIRASEVLRHFNHPAMIKTVLEGMAGIAQISHEITTIKELPGKFRLDNKLNPNEYILKARTEYTDRIMKFIGVCVRNNVDAFKPILTLFERAKKSQGGVLDDRTGKTAYYKHFGIVFSNGIHFCPIIDGEEQALFPIRQTPHGLHMSSGAIGGKIETKFHTLEQNINEFNSTYMSVGFGTQAVIALLTI